MYLIQQIDRYVILNCLKEPKNWRIAKPWWFSHSEAELLAWSAMKWKKKEGRWPNAKECISSVDYSRSRLEEKDLINFVKVDPVDDSTMKDLQRTFETHGKLWDIAVRHHQKAIDKKEWLKLRNIAEELKRVPLVTPEQGRFVDYQWQQWSKLKTKKEYKEERYMRAMQRLIKNNTKSK